MTTKSVASFLPVPGQGAGQLEVIENNEWTRSEGIAPAIRALGATLLSEQYASRVIEHQRRNTAHVMVLGALLGAPLSSPYFVLSEYSIFDSYTRCRALAAWMCQRACLSLPAHALCILLSWPYLRKR
jgi:hypothetical protein